MKDRAKDTLRAQLAQAILVLFDPKNPVLSTETIWNHLRDLAVRIPTGSMDSILRDFERLGCISSVEWMGRDAIGRHGNRTITGINRYCLQRFEQIR